jgi:hypothetical protein
VITGKRTINSIRLDYLFNLEANHLNHPCDLVMMLNCSLDCFGLLDIDLVKIMLLLVRWSIDGGAFPSF